MYELVTAQDQFCGNCVCVCVFVCVWGGGGGEGAADMRLVLLVLNLKWSTLYCFRKVYVNFGALLMFVRHEF